jgi:succinate dehydrogenase / fumarate reductase iron-sulfur subunit
MSRAMNLVLNVWRQKGANAPGQFVRYEAKNVSDHMSFLEMLDVVNEELLAKGEDPIAFDHDCREGICGMCGVVIDGVPHGPNGGTTTCQLHMRSFKDGAKIDSDAAFDAATCIGCGACVAACPNASAALFTAAKISHLALLPQGEPERKDRVRKMVAQMDAEGFGHCTSHGECEAACPKGISIGFIAKMNRELLTAMAAAPNEVKARTK